MKNTVKELVIPCTYTLHEAKYRIIVHRLVKYKGNRTKTAASLNISTLTLRTILCKIKDNFPDLACDILEPRHDWVHRNEK